MDVVIPAVHPDTVAGRVLRCEGVDGLAVTPLYTDTGYGQLLATHWQDGLGFILVEDDMAPWPGAIAELRECPRPWCRFDYSIGLGRFGLGTLGCMKFGPALLRDHPDLADRWGTVHWRNLDAMVVHSICRALGGPVHDVGTDPYLARCHTHTPAIAHARHYRGPR